MFLSSKPRLFDCSLVIAGFIVLLSVSTLPLHAQINALVNNDDTTTTSVVSEVDQERQAAILIQELEAAFTEFKNQYQPLLDRVANDELRNLMHEPFSYFAVNQQNPLRNYHVRARVAQTIAGSNNVAQSADDRYFAYVVNQDTTQLIAWFSGPGRLMAIGSQPPCSIVDMLIIYHELVHVVQDTTLRQQLAIASYEDYRDTYLPAVRNPDGRLLLENELQAYALEIELLNLIVDGRLANDPNLTLDQLATVLHVTDTPNKEHLRVILTISRYYYPDGIIVRNGRMRFSMRYIGFIATQYGIDLRAFMQP